ncbi:hypothetical protein, partial [Staphylococcus aureus]|uniref:hypothetical protein n=1 Tax=Staphylococcus aureus TaxID=1280 RepID=UPI0039BEC0F5
MGMTAVNSAVAMAVFRKPASEHIGATQRRGGWRCVIMCFIDTPAATAWSRSACEQLVQLRELFG